MDGHIFFKEIYKRFIAHRLYIAWTRIYYKIVPVTNLNKYLNNCHVELNIRYYYYYYLLITAIELEVVLTLVQTKQIRINIHKRTQCKNTAPKIPNTINTSMYI